MEPVLILFGIGSVGALVGWGLARVTKPMVAFVLALVGLSGVLALWIAARQAQGWDAISYSIGAFFLLGPAVVGCALGGLIEWVRRRRMGR